MSSDKTAGQWVGTIVGAVVGFYAGGPAGALTGASLGAGVGGLIDPPKGPTIRGPRLEDLAVQNAQYGSPLARIYGTVGVSGTVIWVENNKIKETIKKKKQGGKGGGGGSTVETYSYSGTFAIALGDAPPEGVAAIRRVWVGPNLIYNAGSDDLETIIASNAIGSIDLFGAVGGSASSDWRSGQKFKFYSGRDDQMPDPRIEAEIGVGNAPAYRGTAYIVFYDLPLAKYGNSLMGAQVKVEMISAEISVVSPPLLSDLSALGGGTGSGSGCCRLTNSSGIGFILYLKSSVSWAENRVLPSGSVQEYVYPIPSNTVSAMCGNIDIDDHPFWYRYNGVDYYLKLNDRDFPIDVPVSGYQYLLKSADCVAYVDQEEVVIFDYDTALETARDTITNNWIFALLDSSNLASIADDGLTISVWDTSDLSLASSFQLNAEWPSAGSLGQLTQQAYTCACVNDGVLYIFDPVSTLSLIAIDIGSESELWRKTITNPGDIGDYGGIRIDCSYGLFSVFQKGSGSSNPSRIYRFKLNDFTSSGVPLSDVVEAELVRSELISDSDINVTDLASDVVRGYRPAGVQQVRACIGPLQLAYPFDLIMDGYQIKAVRRGAHSSAATIPAELLDARSYGDAPGIQFDQQREMDSQLPRQVVLRHVDAEREYEVNEQRSAERMSAQSVDVREIDLALVLTPDEAAQIADVEQTRNWLERTPASFRLPPEYLHLQPADVVTIETDYGSFEMLLGEIAYTPDGRLECASRPNAAASYTSPSVGGQGPIPDGEIPLASDTIAILLDIPLMRDEDDEYGFGAAVAGESTSWPGGALLRSGDGGQTWVDLQAFNAPVTMGYCRNSLGESSGALIDYGSELEIDLLAGELESITEAQMLTGLHYCAYGADGRWEIIQFANAVLQASGSYVLSTLVRGIKGTEWATGLHEDGDALVFLDDPDVLVIGAAAEMLALQREYLALTAGQSVDDVASQLFTYRGVNLEPLSPVNPVAVRDGSDWVLSWTRRSRYGSSWWTTGVERPIGETTEAYEIDILDGSAVVRTLTSSTPTITYTSAQQTTDFGAPQTSINYLVYQLSTRVGRGYPLEHAA